MGQGTKDSEHGFTPIMNRQQSKEQDRRSQGSQREPGRANQCTEFKVLINQGAGPVVRKRVTVEGREFTGGGRGRDGIRESRGGKGENERREREKR